MTYLTSIKKSYLRTIYSTRHLCMSNMKVQKKIKLYTDHDRNPQKLWAVLLFITTS